MQNEPEAAVGWEACLWTPSYQAQFVKDHLGPVLHAEQPGVKIIGFDHNKDHVQVWAKGLYADPEAKKWFAGIGIHWCVRAAPTTRRISSIPAKPALRLSSAVSASPSARSGGDMA